jgi:hypothetical protein
MRIRPWPWCLVILLLVLSGSGCGKRLVRVRGVATLDGKPLDMSQVVFTPVGGQGQPAMASTQKDGTFSLYTIPRNPQGEGAWPGEYKVTVERDDYPAPGTPGGPPYPEGVTEDWDIQRWFYKLRAEQKKKPSPWEKVPAKYGRANTTPFQVKVPPDGPVRLELTSN